MTTTGVLLGLTLVHLVTCSDAFVDVETVFYDGCTSQTTTVVKDLKWKELLFINSTIWLEVHSLRPAETSSLHCPGRCDAQKNTLYKVDLQTFETDNDKIKVSFSADEDPKAKKETKDPKKETIQCICHPESLLVFEGSSTLVTCKEESEVKKVRESWKADLESKMDRKPIIIAVGVSFLIIAIFCVLCVVLRVCCASRDQPGAPRKAVRRPTPCRSVQTHISSVETSKSSTVP